MEIKTIDPDDYINPYSVLMEQSSTIEDSKLVELTKKHFPFETANPGQLESIVWAIKQILVGERHIIIGAPTGTGKTHIILTISKVLADLSDGFRTSIITATKGLQQQYVDSDRDVYDLKGRTNYKCSVKSDVVYNSGSCKTIVRNGGCKKALDCPYVIRRRRWTKNAQLRSTNFSFMISSPDILVGDIPVRSQLIAIDECHEIDDNIVEHASIDIYPNMYKFLIDIGNEKIYEDIKQLHLDASEYSKMEYFDTPEGFASECESLDEKIVEVIELLETQLEESKDSMSIPEQNKLGDYVETLTSLSNRLSLFSKAKDGAKWIMNKYENSDESKCFVIKPIFAWQVADYALFSKADVFIHLSATICGVDEYAATLGVTKFVYGEVDNPIPISNRKIYYIPKFKMNRRFTDYASLAAIVEKLAARHAPDNGVIHTVSYALANDIYKHMRNKSNAFIGRVPAEIIDELNNHKSSKICLSPVITTGYDFKGDMARWSIIVKVPFLYLGDPLIKLNSEYRQGWYLRKCILTLVQSAGRCVRGVNDSASTYVLDENFGRVIKEGYASGIVPKWFYDSIVWV